VTKQINAKLSNEKYEQFQRVKSQLGLESDAEVLRFLVTQYLNDAEVRE